MNLTRRIIARAGADMVEPQDTVAPVRLKAKDRGMASRFGLRRLAAPPVLPNLPAARMEEPNDAQPMQRSSVDSKQARRDGEEMEVQPLPRMVEDEAQPLRRESEEETAQTLRRSDRSEAVQPVDRAEDEEAAAAPLRRAEDEAQAPDMQRMPEEDPAQAARETETGSEISPLRRREASFDADLLPPKPADEMRHDTAGATLDGTARVAQREAVAVAGPLSGSVDGPEGNIPVSESALASADAHADLASTPPPAASGTIEGGLVGMPAEPSPVLTEPLQPKAMSERPKVVIDQIEVMVAAPAPAKTISQTQTGARALLARRYLRGR